MTDDAISVSPRKFFTWRIGVLLVILIATISWFGGVARWFKTHPKYKGSVSIIEMSDNSMLQNECGNVVSFSKSLNCSPTKISPLIPSPALSPDVQQSLELQYPYKVFSDSRGETYALVEEQRYEMFMGEICKVYKIEGDQLSLVQELPDELWCDELYTDFKGTWLVRGMTEDGGETSDVYLIDDIRGYYLPEFHNIPLTSFFYDSRDGGGFYAIDNYSGAFYKISFSPDF